MRPQTLDLHRRAPQCSQYDEAAQDQEEEKRILSTGRKRREEAGGSRSERDGAGGGRDNRDKDGRRRFQVKIRKSFEVMFWGGVFGSKFARARKFR